MTRYRVAFIMDVDAESAEDAAYKVAETLADGDPYQGTYDVTDTTTNITTEERPA